MSKRLKGEEEVPMAPLPSYPKGFKSGSFVALNSKPKIFQFSSSRLGMSVTTQGGSG